MWRWAQSGLHLRFRTLVDCVNGETEGAGFGGVEKFGITIATPLTAYRARLGGSRQLRNGALWHFRGLYRQSQVSEIGPCVGRHILPVPIKLQAAERRIEFHLDRIAAADLARRDQVRKWLHQGTIDGALQMTRS